MSLAQQPLAHMTESCTYVEDIPRAVAGQLGQPLAKIALQNGQAEGSLGAGVDLAREVRAQLSKVAISRVKARRNNSRSGAGRGNYIRALGLLLHLSETSKVSNLIKRVLSVVTQATTKW